MKLHCRASYRYKILEMARKRTTAKLSWHMQIFIAITSIKLGWEQNEISIKFQLWWRSRSWNWPDWEQLQYPSSHVAKTLDVLVSCLHVFHLKDICHWILWGDAFYHYWKLMLRLKMLMTTPGHDGLNYLHSAEKRPELNQLCIHQQYELLWD